MINFNKISVSLNGNLITIVDFSITKGIGKGYNTAVVNVSNIECKVGDILSIIINGEINTFYIYEKSINGMGKITLSCKGVPSKLENSLTTTAIYDYIDSDTLISDSLGDVIGNITIPNINFNQQNYSKSSTPLSRINDMVSVILGDLYEVGGVLNVTPLRLIQSVESNVIPVLNIISQTYSEKLHQLQKVRTVYINAKLDNLYSTPSIFFEYSILSGEILYNPSLSANNNYVIDNLTYTPTPTDFLKTEQFNITEVSNIVTLGGIDEVIYINLNGLPLINYVSHLGLNIIRFTELTTGTLDIRYKTKGTRVSIDKTTPFAIKYQCMSIVGEVVLEQNNGVCTSRVIEPITYDKGGAIRVNVGAEIGLVFAESKESSHFSSFGTVNLPLGDLTVQINYRYDSLEYDVNFLNYITSKQYTVDDKLSDTVVYDIDLDKLIVNLPAHVNYISNVYFGVEKITDYIFIQGGATDNYLILNTPSLEGYTIEITYNISVVDLIIPPLELGNPIKYVDVITCGNISSLEVEYSESLMCSLPATFEIDVPSELDVDLDITVGKILTSQTLGDFVVDDRGKIRVNISTQGEYKIKCDSILFGNEIIINSQGVLYNG